MNMYCSWRQFIRLSAAALVHAGALLLSVTANADPIDNIRLSRISNETTTEIELGCAMRYLDHTPALGGQELRVRLSLGYDCQQALRSKPSSLHRPQGARMAHLSIIEFDSAAVGQATITFRFDRQVEFDVRQSANLYMLTIVVDTSKATATASSASSAPTTVSSPTTASMQESASRNSSRMVQRPEPVRTDKFVIRLSDMESIDSRGRRTLELYRAHTIYTNDVTLDQRSWTEVRLGFFDTEQDVQAVLSGLRPHFPSAWVSLASASEQTLATARQLPILVEPPAAIVEAPVVAAASVVANSTAMPDERVRSLMIDARAAMLQADYAQSIKIYTRLLQEPTGAHRREAREFLGVARQKNGQIAHAKAEFQAYLDEFPEGADAQRVSQRLGSLSDIPQQAAMVARGETTLSTGPTWDFYGGVSQFYLRGVNLAQDDEADTLAQSALLSQGNFVVNRRGERFDLVARGNMAFLYDFADEDPENQALVSFAYLDVIDNKLDLNARLGRQTRHRGGVLGRFDGAHISYGLLSNLAVNVTAGFPVDSPRFRPTFDHYFYGASVELSNLADAWDFGLFTNLQTVDGISDRQAFGADVQYHSSRLNVVGLLDYDASYQVLNNGLVTGTWRINDRLTVNGRYQGGASPFLTTRNALIGQPVNTIEALLDDYSEGQVRRLARNRTAEMRSGSGGLTAELTERWQINADVSYNEYGSTVASGGVESLPATGPQYLYSGHLLGSSVLKAGDSLILGYRHMQSRDSVFNTIVLDARFPFGDGLRINPRVAVTRRTSDRGVAGEMQQWVANPMLRVLYRWRQRYRIEFEVGGQWSDQEFAEGDLSPLAPDGSIESSAYYLRLGYWVDFR